MSSPLDVALAYLDALGHDDPDAIAAHVADDFHNEHQSAIGSGCTGRDAYRGRLPDFLASFPNREYTVIETIGPMATDGDGSPDDERTVAVRYRFGADVDGHRIDIPGVMWFGVRDGLIARRIDTWDSLTFFQQTDQEPPPLAYSRRIASSTGVRMRSALIVANRTVGGDQLQTAVHERLAKGPCTFHLVIPVSGVVSSAVAVGSAASDTLPITPLDFVNERDLAEKRLRFGLDWLRSLGADATGEVLPEPDTVAGVCRAVAEHGSSEVIVSTLPTTVSRWLRQDLPHRLERKVAVPVVVVTSTSASTGAATATSTSPSTSPGTGASPPPPKPKPPPTST